MRLFFLLFFVLSSLYADFSRDSTTQIVTDNATGLQWQDNSMGTVMGWSDAIVQCEKLALGARTDWRLPNINELVSIIDFSHYDQAISPIFQNTVSKEYWSSSSAFSGEVFSAIKIAIDFDNGTSSSATDGDTNYVRCVRGGQVSIGSDDTRDDEDSSNQGGVTGDRPNMSDYIYIHIANNINPDSREGIRLSSIYLNHNGFINETVDNDIHCTDYGFEESDMVSVIENQKSYAIFTDSIQTSRACEEMDWGDLGASVSGEKTIVFGHKY